MFPPQVKSTFFTLSYIYIVLHSHVISYKYIFFIFIFFYWILLNYISIFIYTVLHLHKSNIPLVYIGVWRFDIMFEQQFLCKCFGHLSFGILKITILIDIKCISYQLFTNDIHYVFLTKINLKSFCSNPSLGLATKAIH